MQLKRPVNVLCRCWSNAHARWEFLLSTAFSVSWHQGRVQGKQENASTCSSPRGSSTNRKPRPDNVLLSKCVCDRLCSLFGNSTNVSIQTSWWEAKKSAKMWKWSLWHKTDSLDSNSKNYVSTFTLVFTGVVEVTSLQSQTIRNYIPQLSSDDDMTHYGFTDQFTKLTESNNNVTFS